MIDFDLPVLHENLLEPDPLDMDRYYSFVMFNLRNVKDRNVLWEDKRRYAVDVPFVIKD